MPIAVKGEESKEEKFIRHKLQQTKRFLAQSNQVGLCNTYLATRSDHCRRRENKKAVGSDQHCENNKVPKVDQFAGKDSHHNQPPKRSFDFLVFVTGIVLGAFMGTIFFLSSWNILFLSWVLFFTLERYFLFAFFWADAIKLREILLIRTIMNNNTELFYNSCTEYST